MTDNRPDSQTVSQAHSAQNNEQQNQTKKPLEPPITHSNQALTQSVEPTKNVNAIRKVAEETDTPALSKKVVSAPVPQVKKVDISIAGITYPINCPIHEEEELRSAVYYINNFALDLKKNAPNIPQENLLVLTCLNLYEKFEAYTKADNDKRQQAEKAEALLNKVMSDAHSIL